jgi:hypothetical protein
MMKNKFVFVLIAMLAMAFCVGGVYAVPSDDRDRDTTVTANINMASITIATPLDYTWSLDPTNPSDNEQLIGNVVVSCSYARSWTLMVDDSNNGKLIKSHGNTDTPLTNPFTIQKNSEPTAWFSLVDSTPVALIVKTNNGESVPITMRQIVGPNDTGNGFTDVFTFTATTT